MPYQSFQARSCGWSWSSSDRVRYRKLRLEFRPAAIAHRRVWSEERGEGFVFAIIAAEEQMVVVANDWTGRNGTGAAAAATAAAIWAQGARRAKSNGLARREAAKTHRISSQSEDCKTEARAECEKLVPMTPWTRRCSKTPKFVVVRGFCLSFCIVCCCCSGCCCCWSLE